MEERLLGESCRIQCIMLYKNKMLSLCVTSGLLIKKQLLIHELYFYKPYSGVNKRGTVNLKPE